MFISVGVMGASARLRALVVSLLSAFLLELVGISEEAAGGLLGSWRLNRGVVSR